MKNIIRWLPLVALTTGLLVATQCKKDERKSTGILLTVTLRDYPQGITQVQVSARDIDYDRSLISQELNGRDLSVEPLEIFIGESRLTQDPTSGDPIQFLVHARGFNGSQPVVADAKLLQMVKNQVLRETLTMLPATEFVDADGDGFPSCAEPGCDCNDQNSAINPFTREKCDDHLDNNCSGLPVDEGCRCSPEGATRACTSLSFVDNPELKPFVGIGWCKFGAQLCTGGVWQTECVGGDHTPVPEIPDNGIDDNCNGAVDEGSSCAANSARPCLLGRVATGPSGFNFEDIAYGVEGSGVRCRTGVQQCNASDRWENTCVGEVRPQRDPSWVGFVELPSGSDPAFWDAPTPLNCPPPCAGNSEPNDQAWHSSMGQCDGVDNDCDGKVDEEPWFDSDKSAPTTEFPDGQPSPDGYTLCGTNIDTQGGTIPVTDARSKVPGLSADFIDCDDSNPWINPGTAEICGNSVDEDCRCDHDSQNRPVADPYSEIGKPYNQVYDFGTDSQPGTKCSATDAYLNCGRDNPARSDATPPGDCFAGPDSYYYGYYPDDTSGDCYLCDERYGLRCADSPDNDRCSTKAEDCFPCEVRGDRAVLRPLCALPDLAGCKADQLAAWTYPLDLDPNNECPPQTCDDNGVGGGPFYDGLDYLNGADAPECYYKANVTGVCNGAGDCKLRSTECLESVQGRIVEGRPTCMKPASTSCTGTTGPAYVFIQRGEDPYNDCPGTCDGDGNCHSQNGELCDVTHLCEMGVACADDVCCDSPCTAICEACTNALTGQPTGHCAAIRQTQTDTSPATQCQGGTGCGALDCQCDGIGTGAAACKRAQGQQCPGGATTCVSGFCADGFCCNTACNLACQACTSALTAAIDGTCAVIDQLVTDTQPTTVCQGNVGCTGSDCACQPNTGQCLRRTGDSCSAGTECISGNCVDGYCCNSACSGNCDVCAASMGASANGTCTDVVAFCTGSCDVCTAGNCASDSSACTGNCDSCNQVSATQFDCVASAALCTGNCDTCNQISATRFDCASSAALCTGNCDTCNQISATRFDCGAATGVCTGNCSACSQVTATQFDCGASAASCTGNCDTCNQISATQFNCGGDVAICTGNCDVCNQISATQFDCASDATVCTGNCDACNQVTATRFDCAASGALCTGNCDACNQVSATRFDCGSNASLCTGGCDVCNQITATQFNCAADGALCTGNCDVCNQTTPTQFDCGPNDGVCTGTCDDCAMVSATQYDCASDAALCTGTCDVCNQISATQFDCGSNVSLCTGNCDICNFVTSTRYDCAANAAVCVGNCDTCSQISGTRFDCAANASLCTGVCDVCNQVSATQFDCGASAALCTGNCDVCNQVSATQFDCGGDNTVCTGNCDVCNSVTATQFDCAANSGACTGNCDVCNAVSATRFDCAANAGACTGSCDVCNQISGTQFDCGGSPALCTGNCNVCNMISATQYDCTANLGACTGNCDACNMVTATRYDCAASAALCTGNCDACNMVSATQFDCAANNGACTGNCDQCNLVTATRYDCGPNVAACTGNCDACNFVSATQYDCASDVALCTGNCDACNQITTTQFNCAANASLCTGVCDVCNSVTATRYDCAADVTLCTGNCDICNQISSTQFDCGANNALCLGNCDTCNSVSATRFDCGPVEATCAGSCNTCSGGGDTYNCQLHADGAAGSPSCAPYLCDGGANCPSNCLTGADCTGGNACVGPTGSMICCPTGQFYCGGSCVAACGGCGGSPYVCGSTNSCVSACTSGNCSGTDTICKANNRCIAQADCSTATCNASYTWCDKTPAPGPHDVCCSNAVCSTSPACDP